MPLVTVSEIRTYRTCARLWWYKYQKMVRPAMDPKALLIGTATHRALEVFWSGGEKVAAFDLIDEICTGDFWESEMGQMEKIRVQVMISGYWEFWKDERKNWTVIPDGVERIIQLDLGNDIVLGGKVDAMARYKDDSLYMIEHKTSSEDVSSGGADYWQRLALDSQIDTYQSVLEDEFGEPIHILYDVLRKVSTAPKMKKRVQRRKNETDEELAARKAEQMETLPEYGDRILAEMIENGPSWFVRREITRLKEQQEEYIAERSITLSEMFAPGRTVYPRNDGACTSRFGTCPYLGVCAGTAGLDDPKFTQLDDPHPELEGKLALEKQREPTKEHDDDNGNPTDNDGDDPGPIPF